MHIICPFCRESFGDAGDRAVMKLECGHIMCSGEACMDAVKKQKQRCPLKCSSKLIKSQELIPIGLSLIQEDDLPTVSEVVDMYCQDFEHEVVRQTELFSQVQADIVVKDGRIATQHARIRQLQHKVKVRDRRGLLSARIQVLRDRIAQEYGAIKGLHDDRIRLLVALRETTGGTTGTFDEVQVEDAVAMEDDDTDGYESDATAISNAGSGSKRSKPSSPGGSSPQRKRPRIV